MARMATPQTFFGAALRVLADSGRGGLRIGSLCGEVGVTSGSFYHHFGSWEGFVAELLAYWEHEQLTRIVALVEEADPDDRMDVLKGHALRLPHDAEAAIRAWAGTDPTVAEVQRRVDGGRRATVRDVLLPQLADPDQAERLADVAMSILVGHQQLSYAPGPASDADGVDGVATRTALADLFTEVEALVRGHAPARADEVTTSG